jgi:hypothetical protein
MRNILGEIRFILRQYGRIDYLIMTFEYLFLPDYR